MNNAPFIKIKNYYSYIQIFRQVIIENNECNHFSKSLG